MLEQEHVLVVWAVGVGLCCGGCGKYGWVWSVLGEEHVLAVLAVCCGGPCVQAAVGVVSDGGLLFLFGRYKCAVLWWSVMIYIHSLGCGWC